MNVYEAARKRIQYAISEFDNIIVSFSGGKDSGVMLNLTLDIAKEMNALDKVGVYHMDYEAQYQATTDYVSEMFHSLPIEVKKYWVCLPIKAQCSASMFQSFWQPWKFEDKEIWCRELPKNSINERNFPYSFNYEISDYEFNVQFGKEIAKTGKTCFLIGIRTQESLNRWQSIHATKGMYKDKRFSTKIANNLYNVYPIFDWEVEDVWVYNYKFQKPYNKIYDLFYQAGLTVNAMRVASPFNDCAKSSLKFYKVIDPNNWGKMISRVNGVNFTALYGDTVAMGWKSIKLPKGHTWKSYMYFLLDTLPKETKENYLKKLEVSKKSWRVGGARDEELIRELEKEGAPVIRTGKMSKRGSGNKEIIQFEDYLDDTNVTDFAKVPSYKRMCICIMKNDHVCKYMGFAQTKMEKEKRENVMKKYKNIVRCGR